MFQRLARAKDRTKKRLSAAHNPTGTHNSHSTSQNSEFIRGGVRRQSSSQLIIHPRVVVPQVVTMLFHLPQLSSCAYPTCTPAVFIMLTNTSINIPSINHLLLTMSKDPVLRKKRRGSPQSTGTKGALFPAIARKSSFSGHESHDVSRRLPFFSFFFFSFPTTIVEPLIRASWKIPRYFYLLESPTAAIFYSTYSACIYTPKADDEDEDGWGRSAQRTTASGIRVRQQRDPGRLSLRTPPGDDDLDHPDRVSEI